MQISLKKIVATCVLLGGLMTFDLYAPPQGGIGGVSGGGPDCWPPPCIPIDGGIGLLLVAGVAIVGNKLIAAK